MEKSKKELLQIISRLLDSERFSVLSTQKNSQPYASLVAFTATNDLKKIIFLTPETTRKYDNIISNPLVAMLVDNSRNNTMDTHKAVALTITGKARILQKKEKEKMLDLYLKRHPNLKDFAATSGTAVISLEVENYILVDNFQSVSEIRMNS